MRAAGVVGIVLESTVLTKTQASPKALGAGPLAHVDQHARPRTLRALRQDLLQRGQQKAGASPTGMDEGASNSDLMSLGGEAAGCERDHPHDLAIRFARDEQHQFSGAQLGVESRDPALAVRALERRRVAQHGVVANARREQRQQAGPQALGHVGDPLQSAAVLLEIVRPGHCAPHSLCRSAKEEIVSGALSSTAASLITWNQGSTAVETSVGS